MWCIVYFTCVQVDASSSLHGFLKQSVSVAASVGDGISPLATAAKGHVEVLGEKVGDHGMRTHTHTHTTFLVFGGGSWYIF